MTRPQPSPERHCRLTGSGPDCQSPPLVVLSCWVCEAHLPARPMNPCLYSNCFRAACEWQLLCLSLPFYPFPRLGAGTMPLPAHRCQCSVLTRVSLIQVPGTCPVPALSFQGSQWGELIIPREWCPGLGASQRRGVPELRAGVVQRAPGRGPRDLAWLKAEVAWSEVLGRGLSGPSQSSCPLAGSVDSNWIVGATLEKKLPPLPLTLALGAFLNHRKNKFLCGFGLTIG